MGRLQRRQAISFDSPLCCFYFNMFSAWGRLIPFGLMDAWGKVLSAAAGSRRSQGGAKHR
jgi:hypothetical protein